MTQQHTLRRSEQPIQIGPRHGYRIEGDHAFINAELQVPPHHPGGEWTLELWATEQPYAEGPLTGLKIAELAVELPTPIGPYLHQVDARTAARLPLHGRAYAMVLALAQRSPEGETSVHAFANYAEPQRFSAPHFVGDVGYRVQGHEVALQAGGIFNPRAEGNLSGNLSVELWAFSASEPATQGVPLAAADIERLAGQFELSSIETRVAFSEPPVGRFRLSLLLREWTAFDGYVTRDGRDFGVIYERSAPELSAPPAPARAPSAQAAAAPAVAAPATPARPADKLRLVATPVEAPSKSPSPSPVVSAPAATLTPAAPVPAAPALAATAPAATGPVSIQTGSVEELARVKGLNLKIAKEIVKARPFASLADLIRVRGLGEKTIVRLKGLLAL
jgi:DNA uptake protein ComE-like DNA-binding protein